MNSSRSSAALSRSFLRSFTTLIFFLATLLTLPLSGFAQETNQAGGGEANLILPDLSLGTFFGINGRSLLMVGLAICAMGLLFGLFTYRQLRDLPVHKSMLEVSELIWETCKTYLFTQGRFLMILESFVAVIIVLYFGLFQHFDATKV